MDKRFNPITEEDYLEAAQLVDNKVLDPFFSLKYDYNFRYKDTLVKVRLNVGGVQYIVLNLRGGDDEYRSALFGRLREDARQVGYRVFTYSEDADRAEVFRV